jgi:hypothetical protein
MEDKHDETKVPLTKSSQILEKDSGQYVVIKKGYYSIANPTPISGMYMFVRMKKANDSFFI